MKNKAKRIGIGTLIVVGGILAVFFLFIYTIMIATKKVNLNISVIILASLLYFQLLILTIEYIHITFASLYNLKRSRLFRPILKSMEILYPPREDREITRVEMLIYILLSYFFVIFTYALTYLFIGNYFSLAFKETSITFSQAFYLSFTTLTVGPTGLEPNLGYVRWIIMTQIFVGLFYTILIFSLIVNLIQNKKVEIKIK
jgi:hypothetical protein